MSPLSSAGVLGHARASLSGELGKRKCLLGESLGKLSMLKNGYGLRDWRGVVATLLLKEGVEGGLLEGRDAALSHVSASRHGMLLGENGAGTMSVSMTVTIFHLHTGRRRLRGEHGHLRQRWYAETALRWHHRRNFISRHGRLSCLLLGILDWRTVLACFRVFYTVGA